MAQTFHRYRAGDKPVGGYKLIRKLGEGGFGEVWQASAPGGAEVALKFIDLTGQQGFREFKALRLVKKITHINLIPLHGFWLKNEDGTLIDESDVTWSQLAPSFPVDPAAAPSASLATAVFTQPVELIIAMGLGRKSLYDRLRECRDEGREGIPPEELLDYMEDAAKGIDYLNRPIHDLGHGLVPIIHSDIKPHNILIVGDGAAVCDFGLAHAVESLRKTCQAPLTLAYAAPESFRGKPCDKSDQYSFAITYVELRTGTLPFDEGMTGYEVMTAHVQGALDLARLTPAEAKVIRRATAVMPQDRWRSSREMVMELRKALRLTSDSNYMVEAETPGAPSADAARTPNRAYTMMPPGLPSRETSPFSGPTPHDRDPALQTKTPSVAAKILPPPRVEPAKRRMSTGAKLLVSLLLLGAVGGAGGYAYVVSTRTDPNVTEEDDEAARKREAELARQAEEARKKAEAARLEELARNRPRQAFEEALQGKQFPLAMTFLQPGGTFSDSEIADNLRRVRDDWRAHADERFLAGEYALAEADYRDLVKDFPADADIGDARLLLARATLASGSGNQKYRDAKTALDSTDPATVSDSAGYVLGLVTHVLDAHTNEQFDGVEKLLAIYPVQVNQAGVWKPTNVETTELDGALGLTTGRWLKRRDIAADERLRVLKQILAADRNNMDARLAKVEAHVALQEIPQAGDEIAKVQEKDLASNSAQRNLYNVLVAYVALLNNKSDVQLITKTIRDLPALLKAQADYRGKLADGLLALVKRDKTRGQVALDLLANYKNEPAVGRPYAEIVFADFPRRLQISGEFTTAAAEALLADCALIRQQLAQGVEVPEIVRACEAECVLALENRGSALEKLGSTGQSPYYHYVRACALAAEPSPPLPEILISLSKVVQPEPPAELLYAGRAKKAIELLDLLAGSVRKIGPELNLDQLFADPVNQDETQVYQLLRNAYGWEDALGTLSERSLASLALAAQWMKSGAEPALARDLTVELVRSWQKDDKDKGMAADLVFPVYFTCWTAHKDSNADQDRARAIAVARRMMMLGQLPEIALGKQAPALYSKVLEPTWSLAVASKNDSFFGDLGEFVNTFREKKWPFVDPEKKTSVADQLDLIYSQAIRLKGDEADYYYKRGNVHLMKRPADVVKALADADGLERLKASPERIYELRGMAYFRKSRLQKTTATQLAELNNALKEFERLESSGTLSSADARPEQAASILLLFSMVHLERGNYSGSLDRKAAFAAAVDYGTKALQAADKIEDQQSRRRYKERAYQAQGNAYEDLAWMVARADATVDAETNYKLAVESFRAAKNQNKTGDSPVHLARCYYKIVAESDVRPDGKTEIRKTNFLNLTREQLVGEARAELEAAVQSSDLSNSAEAHHWLGRVIQVAAINENVSSDLARTRLTDAQFHAANKQLQEAARIARERQLSDLHITSYTLAWVEHALLHPGFKTGASATSAAQAKTNLLQRAGELRKLGLNSTVAFDPEQEAAILLARGDSFGKGPLTFLEALDKPSETVRKRESNAATRSDIKVIALRMQQRKLIIEGYPERITRKMAVDALDDAKWYADVPDGMAQIAHRVQAFDQAFQFFEALVGREPNNKREYRNRQAEAQRNAILLDPKARGVDERFMELLRIWAESAMPNSGVPLADQIDSARKLASLADSVHDQLLSEKNRSGQLGVLKTMATNLRNKAQSLEAANKR